MKVGVWLIGARGSIATTVVAGAAAVKSGLSPAAGCVTETTRLRFVRPARNRRSGLQRS